MLPSLALVVVAAATALDVLVPLALTPPAGEVCVERLDRLPDKVAPASLELLLITVEEDLDSLPNTTEENDREEDADTGLADDELEAGRGREEDEEAEPAGIQPVRAKQLQPLSTLTLQVHPGRQYQLEAIPEQGMSAW